MPSKFIPPRRARRALLFVLTLIAGLLGFVSHSTMPAGATYAGWCSDGWPPDALVQTDVLSWPIRVGVEVYARPGSAGAIVCYSTSPTVGPPSPLLPSSLPLPPSAGVVGGNVDVVPSTSTPSVSGSAACWSDPGSMVPGSCLAAAGVGIASHGDGTFNVYIPFSVCATTCVGDVPSVDRTGVVVGTLEPITAPGVGAGFRVSNLAIYLDGTPVFNSPVDLVGAFVSPGLPSPYTPDVNGSSPPCFFGNICLPSGALGINGGATTATLVFPVVGAVPVTVPIPSACLVNFSGPC